MHGEKHMASAFFTNLLRRALPHCRLAAQTPHPLLHTHASPALAARRASMPLLLRARFHSTSSARKRDPYEASCPCSCRTVPLAALAQAAAFDMPWPSSLRFSAYLVQRQLLTSRKRESSCCTSPSPHALSRYLTKAKLLHPDVNK